MSRGALVAMRAILLLVAALGGAATLYAAAIGAGSLLRVLTLVPILVLAALADWQLSGRWDGVFGAIFGSRR
ncbi:hypothetical protein ROJ8625_03407 [Roseivivax jejudonensis]|uniref:Uncharacterized protein n=1 Tax=Roseivivax jejudonensis TaxID=1529041 RepID=A0A1X7A0P7_9RHOB|nr:hypothetical protein [Roseivivax jejudonensis]SLN66894.1 hypothetical protein ROJ8625_03407 [Roseivivax jejudonensis]